MILKKKTSPNMNTVKTTNKVNMAEVVQLVLLLVPVFKLARKIMKDRKMK
ncbi:hypothetical protein [Streptococcus bovimastitidis]|nr:hypothetical protein [Streptococcus bovimastitidis]